MQASSSTAVTAFRSDIQGLRAIAVLAVLVYHAGVPFVPGGYAGVDVFFVISGFLITSHLLTALRRTGRIDFAEFYARRARRILPAAFVVLTLSVLAALVWYPPLLLRDVWMDATATAVYVPNLLFAAQGTDYLAETTPSLFQHYWSLGIEEQFYLLWPLGMLLLHRWTRGSRWLGALLLAVVAISFTAGLLLTFRSQPWAFFSLPTRAWELAAGGVVAWILHRRPDVVGARSGSALAWVGLVGIGLSLVVLGKDTPFPGYAALLPVLATAAVILGGASSSPTGPVLILARTPLQVVGRISYSLYLVHWPMQLVPQAAVGFEEPLPVWAKLLLALASVPLAWLLHRFVEEPGRTGRWLAAARPRRSLLAAGAASVAACALAAGALAVGAARPMDAGRAAPETAVSDGITLTGYVPSNVSPALRDVADDQPVIYADGCHLDFDEVEGPPCVYGDPTAPRIVLFGDSHAAQWFPALAAYAQEHGYSLETRTKSSCPSVSVDVERDGVTYAECMAWRASTLEHIEATDPALVVIANYGVAELPSGAGASAWGDGLRTTLDAIDSPVAVIADTPALTGTPSVCLSAHITDALDCVEPLDEAVDGPSRAQEREVAADLGVPLVDMTRYICSADQCGPLVESTIAFRDSHHLTATFSALLSDPLGHALPLD